jgi:hypothetical protein
MMNVKLSHDIGFSTVVIEGSKISPNSFYLKINMVTVSDNNILQNIAIQRILFFLNEVIHGSVLCKITNPIANKFIKLAKDSNVILLPEEPFDQVIGMILYSKLNSIVEGNLEIDLLTIGSEFAPDLTYSIEDFEEFAFDNSKVKFPWWERPDLTTSDTPRLMKKTPEWSTFGLGWDTKITTESGVEFVFEPEYDNNQPAVIVLDGGGK